MPLFMAIHTLAIWVLRQSILPESRSAPIVTPGKTDVRCRKIDEKHPLSWSVRMEFGYS